MATFHQVSCIDFKHDQGIIRLPIIHIVFFSFDKYICKISTLDCKYISGVYTLKKLLELLHPLNFIKVNSHYYVNIYHLRFLNLAENILHLKKDVFELAPQYKTQILKTVGQSESPIAKIRHKQKILFVNKAHIITLETDNGFTCIRYINENRLEATLSADSLQSVKNQLVNYDIRQCNRCEYINLHWLVEISSADQWGHKTLQLKNDISMKLTRRYHDGLNFNLALIGQCDNLVFRELYCTQCGLCYSRSKIDPSSTL